MSSVQWVVFMNSVLSLFNKATIVFIFQMISGHSTFSFAELAKFIYAAYHIHWHVQN